MRDGRAKTRTLCPACDSLRTYVYAWPKGLRYDRCADCACTYRCYDHVHSYDDTQPYRTPADDLSGFLREPMTDQRSREWKWQYANVLMLLRRHRFAKGARALDVGCGPSKLLRYLQHHHGFDVRGVEPSLTEHIRDPFPIFAGTLQEYAATSPEPLGLITLNHVIEHTPDPLAVMRTALGLLAPEGLLVVATPNIGAPNRRIRNKLSKMGIDPSPWKTLDAPKHVILFTPRALRRLLVRAGADIVELATWTRRKTWNIIAGRLRDLLGMGADTYAVARRAR